MSDTEMQKRRRAAASGDPEAAQALKAATDRAYGVRSIFHDWIGRWIYLEAGPNYAEAGLVREVFLDELNRAVVVLDSCRRKSDESDNGPTWLGGPIDGVMIPSTAVSYLCGAEERWGKNWRPK